ncbi:MULTISPECIES: FecR family protein [unclassified Duganella]|uniref:FecR family protein n=1 Tax=unclassified Duganella TaxID=2636909 RepID=UPI0008845673|nr:MULTISPECIES: FecR family protein [unclassified Duganella]SDH28347.1 FecR family protein [Duganella sp. OV458]SDK39155.1 FecR family protein [Duganella sp. OV510]
MSRNIIPTVVLAALAGYSALAYAEDPPAMVGRISSIQGQVTLVGEGEPVGASLNWPVTADNHVNTASGARTEFRVGSTAVRLDSDSDLEIVGMDDDLLRLRLNYGSVSIRVRSPEMLRDFELNTPQARITMLEPGILRVDVDRQPDTSQVTVLEGSARVEGAGSSVVVNNGRHVDITPEDVRTSVARRDGFDVWAEDRDRLDSATTTTRYVSSGMTGYEELDRNGSWTDNVEYGPLWTPRNVALDWAPYRDGRWTWLAPWGWTWVDNASWGYAPSHYGRWVLVERRWRWAPGRPAGRPVWAPALVGWVGGNGGPHHPGPGLGWYPLSPRDRFVPNYRVSSDYERRVTWTHNGKPFTPRPDFNGRRDGLTVLPRDQFDGRRNVNVGRGAHLLPPANFVKNVTPVTPPQGPQRPLSTDRGGRGDRDHDGIPDRFDRNDGRNSRPGPGRTITAPSQPQQVPAQQPPGRISTLAPNQFGHPDTPTQTINPNDMRIELRPRFNPGQPGQPRPQTSQSPVMPQPVLQVSPQQQQQQRERFDRDRNDDDHRGRQREQRPQPQPQAQPQPPRQFTPPPQQAQPAQREHRESRENNRNDNRRNDNPRVNER